MKTSTTTGPQPTLRPSARRLLAVLREMTDADRAAATNVELAARIGTSTAHPRTVTAALASLERAGLIAVGRSKPHPLGHPTGRRITVAATGGSEVAR
jgi:Mn-dependent DtxR family transcriptional regulator